MKEAIKSIRKQVIKLRDKMESLDILGPAAYLDTVVEELDACDTELNDYFLEGD